MIDDAVNIVLRPNNEVMLDQMFVVFDFETTGFNAGGVDSIIEIGAVKIKDGKRDKERMIGLSAKFEQEQRVLKGACSIPIRYIAAK